jgi:K+-transporting ATPase KdpF subunit
LIFSAKPVTLRTDFAGDLTKRNCIFIPLCINYLRGCFRRRFDKTDKDDFLLPLQPKSGFLPEAGRGRPKLLKVIEDGANEAGQPVSRPLSRPSPTANLAGIWKGDPLGREVRGGQVHPNEKSMRRALGSSLRVAVDKIMLDAIYIGLILGHFSRRFCFMRAAAKNSDFYGKPHSRNHFVALCVYLIVAMLRPEKF